MADDMVKCAARYCLHGHEMLNKAEAVAGGGVFYHPDCFQAAKNIKNIIRLWLTHINPDTERGHLTHTLVSMVYQKRIDSGLILFGVKYYINNKLKLNYPPGLYYVVSNIKVLEAYKREQNNRLKKEFIFDESCRGKDDDAEITYHPTPKQKVSDIIG